MKVTYLRLENFSALYTGLNRNIIEIFFDNSKNKIISIQGANGTGKTALLSAITPFSHVQSIDERSSQPVIRMNKEGYKEIHYEGNGNTYEIRHYFRPTQNSHSVKSYIKINGVEKNENGNTKSFLSLIEAHFGITQETMRLIRIGSNVNSFVTLTPSKRKEYIGNLIDEIELYLTVHKKIGEDLRVVKTLSATTDKRLMDRHISDIVVEENRLSDMNKKLKEKEREKDRIVAKIGKIDALEKENNIDEIKRKYKEAEASLIEINKNEELMTELSLHNVTLDQLIAQRESITNKRLDAQSKINSYRISIDTALRNIERLEAAVKKITSNNDIQSLINAIEGLKRDIESSSNIVKGFIPPRCTFDELQQVLNKLISFNRIGQNIYTFGKHPVEIYIKLRNDGKNVDKFLKEQAKKNLNNMNENDIQRIIEQVFQNDMIISPNCDTQYSECPYYRLYEMIEAFRDKLEEESCDSETLKYIEIISRNIDTMMYEIEPLLAINMPDTFKSLLDERTILSRLSSQLPLFDVLDMQRYISMMREYEVHLHNIEKLKDYEHRLSIYKSSGIDSQVEEIKQLRENIKVYQHDISELEKVVKSLDEQRSVIDHHISIVTKYNDSLKYKRIVESTIESTSKILAPLESAAKEKMDLLFQLRSLRDNIESISQEAKTLESNINEYKNLSRDRGILSKKQKDLTLILDAVSTKRGIPVVYMQTYLSKIQNLANSLLRIIYNDEFTLSKFEVTTEKFEIPYTKNGSKVPDIKYASQAELALSTMALSFALANKLSETYNILLLDEIDGGLDEKNRSAFLKMLDKQMNELNAEQVFVISHNLNQMANVPMDVIRLSEVSMNSKLQNIIYE